MSAVAYPSINKVSCVPEIQVKFKTYNKTDSQTYRGRILGCVNFDVARNFGDVIAIHNDMKPAVAKKEIATETFLLIKTSDEATRPFAVCWIDELTFERTDATMDATVIIHNITTANLYQVLTTLRGMGFDVTQVA